MGALSESPVERHLDELFDRLAGTGSAGRRALAEAEDHLQSAVADARARGLDEDAAEREAVARFGPPARIAAQLRATHGGLAALARPAFVGTWIVGAIGLIAVGLSGLVAELFGDFGGATFVAGDAPGVTYTPERCADYFEYTPNAPDCGAAAAMHHWGEVVTGRVAVGVLGILALLALLVARRVTPLREPAWTPPRGVVATVLIALFGVAGVGLTGVSGLQLVFGQRSGVGANLSGGLVALAAALTVALLSLPWVRGRARTIAA